MLLAGPKLLQNLENAFGTPRATCLEVKVVQDSVRGELLVLPRYSACVEFLELGLTLVVFVQIPLEKNEGNAGLGQVLEMLPSAQIISKLCGDATINRSIGFNSVFVRLRAEDTIVSEKRSNAE